jgi:hypothetical protein
MHNELPVLSFGGHEGIDKPSMKPPETLLTDSLSDAVSNVAFHPKEPHLLTVSGSYHFASTSPKGSVAEPDDSSAGSSTEEVGNEGANTSGKPGSVNLAGMRIGMSDSSMKLWKSGPE